MELAVRQNPIKLALETPLDQNCVSSIFPAKRVFQDGNSRTSTWNPATCAYPTENQGLQNEKAEDMIISENISGYVARTGIEPATQGFSVLCSTD